MAVSSIILKCSHCLDKLGSLDIDEISLVTPTELVDFLVQNRVRIMCDKCQCEHGFE